MGAKIPRGGVLLCVIAALSLLAVLRLHGRLSSATNQRAAVMDPSPGGRGRGAGAFPGDIVARPQGEIDAAAAAAHPPQTNWNAQQRKKKTKSKTKRKPEEHNLTLTAATSDRPHGDENADAAATHPASRDGRRGSKKSKTKKKPKQKPKKKQEERRAEPEAKPEAKPVAAGKTLTATSARPHGDANATHPTSRDGHRDAGPPATACREIEGHRKFFLYELKAAGLCQQGAALLRAVQALDHTHRQELGPELFLAQQLADHPRRTRDPAEADLFVVPPLLGLGTSQGMCGVPMETLVREVHRELLASPHYQRHEGRDHLLALFYWEARFLLRSERALLWWGDKELVYFENLRYQQLTNEPMASTKTQDFKRGMVKRDQLPPIFAELRHALRHFIIAGRNSKTSMQKGMMVTVPGNIITVPHLAPSALDACTHRGGRIRCPARGAEASFEEYAARRNYTLFFVGNDDRLEVKGGQKARQKNLRKGRLLRPRVVHELGAVRPPNILMRTNAPGGEGEGPPVCSFAANVTTDCRTPPLSPRVVAQKMGQSRFALHVQGDDASSSRVFDALVSGTPQLFLAERYYADVAPFKCQVPWDRAFRFVDTKEFVKGPAQTMRTLLDRLMGDPEAVEWRQLWEAQRAAADDLLWHTPGSRVGNNAIEDAFREQDRIRNESSRSQSEVNGTLIIN